ncbi:SAM-dependent methyltransferase [Frigoribacterium sp. PvP032]|uniref:SAM-dependent methyltransferase n=1 Tax=Frigoribacterium sp. PvP032 TaxID=2806589 RepID=UPI001AE6D8DC|nr:SAM-dependent methyltransferase [Frigoribacterium sp. PvP032]MBP1191038.1 thioredoxin reductase/SAM-dependent methyltransferase [Frigoribacterium sp. PvP032]
MTNAPQSPLDPSAAALATTPTPVPVPAPAPAPTGTYDVVVVGGGAAGLSAGLTLARARRRVLVVDAGEPRNAPAAGVHGFLTRDGIVPRELTRLGRAEVEQVGGEVVDGTVTRLERAGGGPADVSAGAGTSATGASAGGASSFTVSLTTEGGDERVVRARRVVVTTGLTDELPEVDGLAERWGRDVVHCPYCHGWEIRDRVIGVLGTTPFAVHQALMFRQWSDRVTLFVHEAPEPADDEWEQLAARGIQVVTGRVRSLRLEGDALTGVLVDGAPVVPVDALAVAAAVRPNGDLLEPLGLVHEPHPMGLGTVIASDPLTGATTAPGLYLAGNVADARMQVVTAAASGVGVAVAVNMSLITEDTDLAVAERRRPFGVRAEAENTTRVLGDRRHGLGHEHGDGQSTAEEWGRDYWEDRYAAPGLQWSGRPNPVLVDEVSALTPGRVLDVGSGEGGDAIWLAGRGWQVTAIDIAQSALDKAAARAAEVDEEAAARITWEQHDLAEWAPAPRSVDLVSSQFMHLADPVRAALFRSLAEAVAPGGTLLVVGHDLSDLTAGAGRHGKEVLMFTIDDVLAAIPDADWTIEVAESRARQVSATSGGTTTVRDVVVKATRAS